MYYSKSCSVNSGLKRVNQQAPACECYSFQMSQI